PIMKPISREELFKPQGGCSSAAWDERLLGCDAPLDPNEKHILIIGDSFAAAAGNRVEDSFSYNLRFPGFQVRNCAVSGNDLNAILASFDTQRARFRPTITVYAFVLNDFNDVASRSAER